MAIRSIIYVIKTRTSSRTYLYIIVAFVVIIPIKWYSTSDHADSFVEAPKKTTGIDNSLISK